MIITVGYPAKKLDTVKMEIHSFVNKGLGGFTCQGFYFIIVKTDNMDTTENGPHLLEV